MTTIHELALLYIDWKLVEAAAIAEGKTPPQHAYHVMKRRKVATYATGRTRNWRQIAKYRTGLREEVKAHALKILNERLGE